MDFKSYTKIHIYCSKIRYLDYLLYIISYFIIKISCIFSINLKIIEQKYHYIPTMANLDFIMFLLTKFKRSRLSIWTKTTLYSRTKTFFFEAIYNYYAIKLSNFNNCKTMNKNL